MTFLYPNPFLQMKNSFWRIHIYVICRKCQRSRCKRCVCAEMKLLADWKRLMLQKGFSHSFDVLVTYEVFLSLTVFVFEGKENALLFCHNWQVFFQAAIIFATNFCELVHVKTFVLPTDCCFWKKDLKIKAERRRNHWRQKRVVFQKTFWTSPRKTRKFRRYCILSLFGQWNQSKEFSKQLSFSGSKVHPLKRSIKDRQRICFLSLIRCLVKFVVLESHSQSLWVLNQCHITINTHLLSHIATFCLSL